VQTRLTPQLVKKLRNLGLVLWRWVNYDAQSLLIENVNPVE